MKIDPVGIGIWSVAYLDSTSRYGAGESLTLDNNLNVIVTGVLGGNGYTSDIVTVKYNQLAGIIRISDNYPVRFLLNQNYPNPFNPSTTIQFSIPPSKGDRGMTSVKLIIYDVLGREVATLINQQMQPGSYSVDWDASNYPSGIYFYKLEAGDNVQSKKMVLIK
jgi:hypothetical protein